MTFIPKGVGYDKKRGIFYRMTERDKAERARLPPRDLRYHPLAQEEDFEELGNEGERAAYQFLMDECGMARLDTPEDRKEAVRLAGQIREERHECNSKTNTKSWWSFLASFSGRRKSPRGPMT